MKSKKVRNKEKFRKNGILGVWGGCKVKKGGF